MYLNNGQSQGDSKALACRGAEICCKNQAYGNHCGG